MNLSEVKNKLTALTTKPTSQKYEKVDYSKIYWKPKIGKHQIRIVPSVLNKTYPFKEVFLHYGFSKFPIFALNNWGEQDPIIEFAKGLQKTGIKEDWVLGKKLEPKMRVYVPVIVRGEEEKGVRLWEFGKTTYQELLGTADDEDYGDFSDINEGRDFTVDTIESEVAGNKATKSTLRIKPKTSVLTDNPEYLKVWLVEQPNILNIAKKHSFEELKTILDKWLNPEDSTTDEVPALAEAADITPTPAHDREFLAEMNAPVTETSVADAKKKTKAKDKFDKLF